MAGGDAPCLDLEDFLQFCQTFAVTQAHGERMQGRGVLRFSS